MDLKLIHRTLPRFCRHEPFLLGVAQGKKEELGSGVIAREVALGADDFTQLEVEGLDRIGRVEDASDLVGEGKEASYALPVTTPGGDDRGVGLSPLGLKVLEGVQSKVLCVGSVNVFEVGTERLSLGPGDEACGVSNHMHGLGK